MKRRSRIYYTDIRSKNGSSHIWLAKASIDHQQQLSGRLMPHCCPSLVSRQWSALAEAQSVARWLEGRLNSETWLRDLHGRFKPDSSGNLVQTARFCNP